MCETTTDEQEGMRGTRVGGGEGGGYPANQLIGLFPPGVPGLARCRQNSQLLKIALRNGLR